MNSIIIITIIIIIIIIIIIRDENCPTPAEKHQELRWGCYFSNSAGFTDKSIESGWWIYSCVS
jgi:hypothetical protein